jgi:hypothetical protein
MWSDQDNLPAATNNGTTSRRSPQATTRPMPRIGRPTSCRTAPSRNIYADNHINMKATSDGTLYMVGKANTDTVSCATLKDGC